MFTMRSQINSFQYKNTPFVEKTKVFMENSTNDNLRFVKYEFMHIRLKPQSTQFVKSPATSNSLPHYVMVVLYSNNILKVYENTKKTQVPGNNTKTLFTMNLTTEGVCDKAEDVILLETAQ